MLRPHSVPYCTESAGLSAVKTTSALAYRVPNKQDKHILNMNAIGWISHVKNAMQSVAVQNRYISAVCSAL